MFCTKCGNKLNEDDAFCAKCGTKAVHERAHDDSASEVATEEVRTSDVINGLRLPPKRTLRIPSKEIAQRRMKQSAIKREMTIQTGRLGQSLGERSAAHDALLDGLSGDSLSGCLFMPFVLLNPFFWFQWHYKSKAKAALEEGNIDEANENKDLSTRFAVAGWILIALVLGVILLIINN